MKFTEFISRQRIGLFAAGSIIFILSLVLSDSIGFSSLWGELFIDLAASSVTIIFTAFIIDYLTLREQFNKTQNAAGLAAEEIRGNCFRIKMRLAVLFGLERKNLDQDRTGITNRQEVLDYLEATSKKIDDYLSGYKLTDKAVPINETALPKYIDRLEASQVDLEQTLLLYEYAIPLPLRESVLALRSDLLVAERLLGYLDNTESLTASNLDLIRQVSQSIYESVENVISSL